MGRCLSLLLVALGLAGCTSSALATLEGGDIELGTIEDETTTAMVTIRSVSDQTSYAYFSISNAAFGDEIDEEELLTPPLEVPDVVELAPGEAVEVELRINCIPELPAGSFAWRVPVVAGLSDEGVWSATTGVGDLSVRGLCP